MFSFIFIWSGQFGPGRGGEGPEEGADCSAAVADGSEVCCVLFGWMSVFAVCLQCLYGPRLPDSLHRDSRGARPGPGNDCYYAERPLCLSSPHGDGYGM